MLGGPPAFTGALGDQPGVLCLHAGNGDMGDLGERFLARFLAALDDAGWPAEAPFRAALEAYMRWAVDDVLAYSAEDAVVPPGVAMPRWDWDRLRA